MFMTTLLFGGFCNGTALLLIQNTFNLSVLKGASQLKRPGKSERQISLCV
jgi:hypothetical protein